MFVARTCGFLIGLCLIIVPCAGQGEPPIPKWPSLSDSPYTACVALALEKSDWGRTERSAWREICSGSPIDLRNASHPTEKVLSAGFLQTILSDTKFTNHLPRRALHVIV